MTDPHQQWDERYRTQDAPWDTGRPSSQLQRVLREYPIDPCRALELGCGTGTNAVFLASQGFEVTAFDISSVAIERAEKRARAAGVAVRFLACGVRDVPDLGEPFPFVFDRGVYHTVRQQQLQPLLELLRRVTRPGTLWLTLAGNANEPSAPGEGPPRVRAEQICTELEPLFAIVHLREFRFDPAATDGPPFRPLAWSVLLRRR